MQCERARERAHERACAREGARVRECANEIECDKRQGSWEREREQAHERHTERVKHWKRDRERENEKKTEKPESIITFEEVYTPQNTNHQRHLEFQETSCPGVWDNQVIDVLTPFCCCLSSLERWKAFSVFPFCFFLGSEILTISRMRIVFVRLNHAWYDDPTMSVYDWIMPHYVVEA